MFSVFQDFSFIERWQFKKLSFSKWSPVSRLMVKLSWFSPAPKFVSHRFSGVFGRRYNLKSEILIFMNFINPFLYGIVWKTDRFQHLAFPYLISPSIHLWLRVLPLPLWWNFYWHNSLLRKFYNRIYYDLLWFCKLFLSI